MSLNRVMRYLGGLVIATLLLVLLLPLAGIAPAKFLPPPAAYARAEGLAQGVVTGKEVSPTGNPFQTGDHVWLISYKFLASPPLARGEIKPGPRQEYDGTVRTEESLYNAVDKGTYIPKIRFEKTYPDINGIDNPAAQTFSNGRSVGPGSAMFSGWILFVLLDLALAYLVMAVVLERFGKQENI